MIERISCHGLPIPLMYRVDTEEEADIMRRQGLPYIISELPVKMLIKAIMLPVLRRHYPGISWERFLNIPADVRNEVIHVPGRRVEQGDPESQRLLMISVDGRISDSADEERSYSGQVEESHTVRLEEALRDCSAEVDPKILSDLNLLPQFLGDIESIIRRNLYAADWTEGYSKKLRVPLGNFNASRQARNLLIVDISSSIPDGISSTLLALLHTMRHTAEADVIVTGSTSMYWEADKELPTAEWIRNNIGLSNESKEFDKILRTKIAGNHYGNVIVFGDNDSPYIDYESPSWVNSARKLDETQVDNLVCYHTNHHYVPGYGRWAKKVAKAISIDCTRWCSFLKKKG